MLDEAREKKGRKPSYADLTFDFGDCMALPLDDHSVDAVTISFGVRNFEDRQRGLREDPPRPPPRRTPLRPRILPARPLVQPHLLLLPQIHPPPSPPSPPATKAPTTTSPAPSKTSPPKKPSPNNSNSPASPPSAPKDSPSPSSPSTKPPKANTTDPSDSDKIALRLRRATY